MTAPFALVLMVAGLAIGQLRIWDHPQWGLRVKAAVSTGHAFVFGVLAGAVLMRLFYN